MKLSPNIYCICILHLRWANTPPAGHVWTVEDDQSGLEFQHMDDEEIQRYISAMEDSRSDRCKVMYIVKSRYVFSKFCALTIMLSYMRMADTVDYTCGLSPTESQAMYPCK